MGTAPGPQGRLSALALCEAHADATLAELARVAPRGALDGLGGRALLHERAALGATPASRSCRLLEAGDGWLALNLARDDDWELLPAWLEAEVTREWDAIASVVRERSASGLVARGREIGLAVALDAPPAPSFPRQACPELVEGRESSGDALGPRFRGDDGRRVRVIDLSSLWAGPLCGRLLARLGCEVIKVESVRRPDGARRGAQAFFDAMNGAKHRVSLDFTSGEGLRELGRLIRSADIVIESSRPRALRQLGIVAEDVVAQRPGLTWISIVGYGRDAGRENWIAYGDDAGVAAGLSHLHWQQTGERAIVGDAIADPLTGLHAALAAWLGYRSGQGGLVPVALRDVVADAIAGPARSHLYAPEGAFLGTHNENRHQGEVSGADRRRPEDVHGQAIPREEDGSARGDQVQGAPA